MMGYTSPEFSIEDGRPVELYRFRTAAGLDYRFTNSENEITDDEALVYTPASITRDQFSQSQERRATEMTIEMPYLADVTAEFATQFIDKPPEGKTSITIKRHHLTDSGNVFIQLWEGTLVSGAYTEQNTLEALCRGIKNIYAREGPRMVWGGPMCQHSLYDNNCTILAASFTDFNPIVTALSSNGIDVTLSGLSSPLRDFVGGKMIKDNGKDYRLIVAQAGNVLTLQQPFRSDFIVGDTVDIEQGCDHNMMGDCLNVFNNTVNFGSAPFTPGLNPFVEGLDKL